MAAPPSGGRFARYGWAPRFVEVILAMLIAFLLAQAALAFFAPLPVPKGDRMAALSNQTVETTPIAARNPFPKQAVEPVVVEAAPELAETALDLGLTGVWPEASGGSAIIRRPDGKQRRFAVGEEIVSGVTLAAVYSDQVIIEQNGVREALRFETKAPIERIAPQSVGRGPVSQPERKIDNRVDDGQFSLNAFRLQPVRDSSGSPAIAIFAGRDPAAFRAAGLEDGDILRSVNGAPPPLTPQDLSALLQQLARVGAATIVVERDGAQRTINLSLNKSGNE